MNALRSLTEVIERLNESGKITEGDYLAMMNTTRDIYSAIPAPTPTTSAIDIREFFGGSAAPSPGISQSEMDEMTLNRDLWLWTRMWNDFNGRMRYQAYAPEMRSWLCAGEPLSRHGEFIRAFTGFILHARGLSILPADELAHVVSTINRTFDEGFWRSVCRHTRNHPITNDAYVGADAIKSLKCIQRYTIQEHIREKSSFIVYGMKGFHDVVLGEDTTSEIFHHWAVPWNGPMVRHYGNWAPVNKSKQHRLEITIPLLDGPQTVLAWTPLLQFGRTMCSGQIVAMTQVLCAAQWLRGMNDASAASRLVKVVKAWNDIQYNNSTLHLQTSGITARTREKHRVYTCPALDGFLLRFADAVNQPKVA